MRIPASAPRPRSTRGASRVVVLVVAVAALGVAGALAVPALFSGGEEEPVAATDDGTSAAIVPAGPAAPAAAADAALAAQTPAPAGPAPVTTSADGDLVLQVSLRTPTAASGAGVTAVVRFVNTSLVSFHVPAAGEPHPTLSVVVLDAEGNEVRRVVETGPDPYPRRTFELKSGGALDVPVVVVSGDDAALPPGDYTVAAEFRRDPVWSRLGLPMWTAPRGSVRSTQEPLRVVQ